MSSSMEDPVSALPTAPAAASRALSAAAGRQCDSILDECVEEFTRRLQACVALPEDDERFWERVRADVRALRSRCQPQDAFAFQIKAARILADFGFASCPGGVLAPTAATPQDTPPPRPFAVGAHPRPSGTRAA